MSVSKLFPSSLLPSTQERSLKTENVQSAGSYLELSRALLFVLNEYKNVWQINILMLFTTYQIASNSLEYRMQTICQLLLSVFFLDKVTENNEQFYPCGHALPWGGKSGNSQKLTARTYASFDDEK